MRLIDKLADTRDFCATINRATLTSIIGENAMVRLEKVFGEYTLIRVRKVQSAPKNFIPFHTDFSRRTMQISLNAQCTYSGGEVVFVTQEKFIMSPRHI